jgi:Tfp pilus assembly protein PilE
MSLGAPKCGGFSILDLMLAVVIMSLLVAVAVPAYDQFVDRAKNARAIGDIGSINVEIDRFRLKNNDRLPNSQRADDGNPARSLGYAVPLPEY